MWFLLLYVVFCIYQAVAIIGDKYSQWNLLITIPVCLFGTPILGMILSVTCYSKNNPWRIDRALEKDWRKAHTCLK